MSEPVVLVEKANSIATITLNRPEVMNALSNQLRIELVAAFNDVSADPAIDVVILTGKGRAFCGGLDLKELGEKGLVRSEGATPVGFDVLGAIEACPKPIIGAINGAAVTGGFELALMCDVMIASRNARFADTHARVGILPGWGLSQKLARIIGISRANEMHFTGNFLNAEQAFTWGLVNRVVTQDELMPVCVALAEDMVSCDQKTVRTYKQMVTTGYRMDLKSGLEIERMMFQSGNASVTAEEVAARKDAVIARGRSKVR